MRSISKIALAGAVATACGYSAAATLTGGTVTPYSLESAQLTAGTTEVVYSGLGVNSAAGTFPKLTIQTAAIATGQRLTISGSRAFGSVSGHTQTFTCTVSADNAAAASVVFTIATAASNSTAIVYDVTAAGGNTTNATCNIPSIAFNAASLASAGDITVSGLITINNTGATMDSFTSTKIASVGNEFTVAVGTAFNAQIDVASNRLTFSSGTDSTTAFGGGGFADNFVVTSTGGARTTVGGAYAGTFQLVVTAGTSFGFLQEPASGTANVSCSADSGNGQATAVAGTGARRIALSPTSGACKDMTVAWASLVGTPYTLSLGRTTQGSAASVSTAFAPQTYSATYSLTNGTLTASNTGSLAAGEWTQNGTTANLQYVPITSTSSLQIFVANTSSVGGAVTFTAFNDSGATCTGDLGAVVATGTTSIGGKLRSALLGSPATGTTTDCTSSFASAGRAAVTLVSTTPAASTRIHSGFSVSDTTSRGLIINSTN